MSCAYRLRSYDAAPPGGYPYVQTDGLRRNFPSQPIPEAQARIVSDFRRANNLQRPSVEESLEDVVCFTCQRLGNNPSFCVSIDSTAAPLALNTSSPIIAPCKGCGVVLS